MKGTPQDGPLSPLLSNILLDQLDKELEARGHAFCRYADDCNLYVRSRRSGERVMASLTGFREGKMKLKVNRDRSALDRPVNRVFLGYSVTIQHQTKIRVSSKTYSNTRGKSKGLLRMGRGATWRSSSGRRLTPYCEVGCTTSASAKPKALPRNWAAG